MAEQIILIHESFPPGSLGIQIANDPLGVRITDIVDGSQFHDRLRIDDIITHIDGERLCELTLIEFLDLIRRKDDQYKMLDIRRRQRESEEDTEDENVDDRVNIRHAPDGPHAPDGRDESNNEDAVFISDDERD
eukprot:273889_1